MKDRGCEWTGKLEGLEAHLDVNTGDCEYVDVECPNKCDLPVEKRNVPTHIANSCPKREFVCQYCNFKASYEIVSNDHWPQCSFHPVACPNTCGNQAFERGDLEAHLLQCPLEEVECNFSHAGCNTKLLRKDMERHMEENTQKHLVLMSASTLRISRELQEQQDKLHTRLKDKDKETAEKVKEKDEKIAAMEASLKQKDAEMREIQRTRKEKDQRDRVMQEQLQTMRAEIQHMKETEQRQVQRIEKMEGYMGIAAYPPTLEMPNFKKHMKDRQWWYSRPLYTHPGGYKVCIGVYAYGSEFSDDKYVVACFYSMKGEFDHHLQWPAKRTITLQLLNRERDQDHVTKTEEIEWSKTTFTRGVKYFNTKFIAHADLDYNLQKQTCYLLNDSLLFRVTTTEAISL